MQNFQRESFEKLIINKNLVKLLFDLNIIITNETSENLLKSRKIFSNFHLLLMNFRYSIQNPTKNFYSHLT